MSTLVPYPYLCAPCKQARDFMGGRAGYSAMVQLKMQVPCEECCEREEERQKALAFQQAAQQTDLEVLERTARDQTAWVAELVRREKWLP